MLGENQTVTLSGMKSEGDWDEVCDFARRLENILKTVSENQGKKAIKEIMGEYQLSIKRYHEWRPRENENETIISKRTATTASLKKQKVEKEFNGTTKELQIAGKKVKETIICRKNKEKSTEELKEASKCIYRILGAKSVGSIRKFEKLVYEKIMLRFNPYSFDTEHFSVNLQRINNGRYRLTVNVSNDMLRKKIRKVYEISQNN